MFDRNNKNLNKKYHRFKTVVIFCVVIAVLFIASKYFSAHSKPEINPAISNQSSSSDSLSSSTNYSLSASEPEKIIIPTIGVQANVIHLGLNPDQTLEVPKKDEEVGWYTGSPTPGEIGPSVMVGHLDSTVGAAVFYNLKKLKPGDVIEIQRQDGSIAKFQAESMEMFSQDNFPTDKVYGQIDYAGLRLITCAGTYSRAKGHYSDNLVVFARLIKS